MKLEMLLWKEKDSSSMFLNYASLPLPPCIRERFFCVVGLGVYVCIPFGDEA